MFLAGSVLMLRESRVVVAADTYSMGFRADITSSERKPAQLRFGQTSPFVRTVRLASNWCFPDGSSVATDEIKPLLFQ